MSPKTIILSGNSGSKPAAQIKGNQQHIFSTKSQEVEIVWVVDSTGSMERITPGIVRAITDLVDQSSLLQLDLSFAVISFGDLKVEGGGDKLLLEVPLTQDVVMVKQVLPFIHRNDGFGNGGESSLEALELAMKLPFSPTAIKVLVLITDDYAHQHRLQAKPMIETLKKRGFMVYVLSIPASYFKDMAQETGGTWTEISANSSLNSLMEMLQKLVINLTVTARQIALTAGGDVTEYLRLNPPKDSR